jgi:hypothetical protein
VKYLSIFLSITTIFSSQSAISKERKTIKDYFLEIPATYIRTTPEGSQITRTDRSKILESGGTIVDINNGYLRTTGDTCFHELAIFNRSKGSPLIAINTACTIGDSIAIVDPDRNWKNVTTQLFPMKTLKTNNEAGVTIKLPRQGRTITISEDNRTVRWKIDFKNDKFQIVKTF